MHAKAIAASALFTSSLASLVTPSASTSDPTITPGPNIELFRKQNNDRYMGWVAISGVWSSQQCESGATYFQSGGHWRCCATTAAGCDVPQACVNGNLIYDGAVIGESTSLTFPCTSVYPDPTDRTFTICNTAFMYENDQDSSPQTNVNCGISSVNWSYYRAQPEAAKTTSQSSNPRSTNAVTSSIDNGDTNGANPTLVPTNQTNQEETSSSKAWIAGAVVGPIVGLALIGFLVWFCLRRKKKAGNAASSSAAATATYAPPPTTGPTSPQPYYPPPMQQQAGMAPFGVTDSKQAWAPSPVSPTSQVSSPAPQSMYGAQYPQQGGHAGPGNAAPAYSAPRAGAAEAQGQPVYSAPSPSMSPPPGGAYAENTASYHQPQAQTFDARPFSSELDATGGLQSVNVQPK